MRAGFYLLGLTNSRYAESIHWERTFVAIIGAFAIAFIAGTIHLILNEWHAAKGWGHFVFLAAIVLFTALNQGIVYNPWDPALQQVDVEFDKPTFLSHVGVLVVTVSTLILTGFAVAAGFLSAGFSTLPKIVVGLLSPPALNSGLRFRRNSCACGWAKCPAPRDISPPCAGRSSTRARPAL